MKLDFLFFFNSILLGVGLAMDAFSVSLANGLGEPRMKPGKMCWIAGTFGFFQAAMPMLGWVCVHTMVERFRAFSRYIPWIALILLGFIGGKMLYEGIQGSEEAEAVGLTHGALLLQGIATSIDALSVGFTIASDSWYVALLRACIIAAVTFAISLGGVVIGKKAGTKLSDKAAILGGVILIAIGLEIWLSGIL